MKDLISKLTFGFLMAQLIPGAVAVCSVVFLYAAFTLDTDNTIKDIVYEALWQWRLTLLEKVLFAALCTGAGMLIHGLHWAVLGYMERYRDRTTREMKEREIYETFWHGFPIYLQILLGPIKIIIETLGFLFNNQTLHDVTTQENVPEIDKDKMEAFNFLQDFYLHFAQFYAHSSYALIISLFSMVIFICFFGPTIMRFFLLAIGRIQLSTLFIAEHQMCDKKVTIDKVEQMGRTSEIIFEAMKEEECEEAVELIALSMNSEEACWARETMKVYFACRNNGIDSGREYYIWRNEGTIQGLVGLHHQIWGPKENVWLSWFAVHPAHHGKGIGSKLIDLITEKARQAGYKKFLVETYSSPTFEKARSFYKAKDFSEIGRIEDYLPDGAAMVVFGKRI